MSPLVVAVVDSAKACWLTTVTLVVMQMSPLAVASAISVAGVTLDESETVHAVFTAGLPWCK